MNREEKPERGSCIKPFCEAPIASQRLRLCRSCISKLSTARAVGGGREAAQRYSREGWEGRPLCQRSCCFEHAEQSGLCERHEEQAERGIHPGFGASTRELVPLLKEIREALDRLAPPEDYDPAI